MSSETTEYTIIADDAQMQNCLAPDRKRVYRVLKLENGLIVMLISDRDARKAAACMVC